ncbi:hypothetical protein SeMB42_g00535 [Synchytrium endobioticum]|uniref:Anaphase-promoting complex subunit 4 WD40 domain-containing protein n=1 Tax=Synchytrium endobioticum TaxID=286115 RepID=A0A507DJR6_9FUNG|nr:hypothetical protein SeLEV6574_g00040 [Synchytrium endobioticum]TPX53958.1 hypothetical protein SeMB42_g00535 [Synchytrium endobioticum]
MPVSRPVSVRPLGRQPSELDDDEYQPQQQRKIAASLAAARRRASDLDDELYGRRTRPATSTSRDSSVGRKRGAREDNDHRSMPIATERFSHGEKRNGPSKLASPSPSPSNMNARGSPDCASAPVPDRANESAHDADGWTTTTVKGAVHVTALLKDTDERVSGTAKVKIVCSEGCLPGDVGVKVYAAPLVQLLQALPEELRASELFVDDKSMGVLENVDTGARVQVHSVAGESAKFVFAVVLGQARPTKAAGTVSAKPTNLRPGPLSRLNDDDINDEEEDAPNAKSSGPRTPSSKQHDNADDPAVGLARKTGLRTLVAASDAPVSSPTKTALVNDDDASVTSGCGSGLDIKRKPNTSIRTFRYAGRSTPSESLVLEHIHGYRMRDTANNLVYVDNDTIVFTAGCVGVVHDLAHNKQRFFMGKHRDDVVSLCLHPARTWVASGDMVARDDGCSVYIWDPRSPDARTHVHIRVGEKKLARGVAATAFSPDGQWLAVIGMDQEHTIYIYDWEKSSKPMTKVAGHTDAIFGVTFNPHAATEFVTYGVKHLTYWIFNPLTGAVDGTRGVFGPRRVPSILCAAFLPDGSYVTGSHAGDLLVWRTHTATAVLECAHRGPVFAIASRANTIVTSGKDGRIVLRDSMLRELASVQVESGVRALCFNADASRLLAGLEDSVIVEIEGLHDGTPRVEKIMAAHSAAKLEEVSAVDVNPRRDAEYVTVGDDSKVIKWDAKHRKMTAITDLPGRLRAVAYSPDGTIIAVGNDSGGLYLLHTDDLSQAWTHPHREPGIETMRFSPSGQYLAVGTRGCAVDVYDVRARMHRVARCTGHESYVTHIDWSADSRHMQTNAADGDLRFWAMPDGTPAAPAAVADAQWSTYSCVRAPPVLGIWGGGMDAPDVTTVCRNPAHTCCASGDDSALVKLHCWPAHANMPSKEYLAHGAHVTKVAFTAKGSRLISTGGMDGCVMQWLVRQE